MAVVNPGPRLPILRAVSIFRGLSKANLFEVARRADEVTYPAGAVVAKQGDPGDTLCVVATGTLEVVRDGSVVAQLGPGNYFGEISLIDSGPRTATIVTLEEVVLLTVSAADFDALLNIPYLARTVIKNLAYLLRHPTGDPAPSGQPGPGPTGS